MPALKARIAELEKTNAAPRAAKPKAEPPDEARERIIKGLRTRVRNLTEALQYQLGVMPRETRTAIDKVLHPDTRDNTTEADRDRAVKGWNLWKIDNDKAHAGDRQNNTEPRGALAAQATGAEGALEDYYVTPVLRVSAQEILNVLRKSTRTFRQQPAQSAILVEPPFGPLPLPELARRVR